MSSKRSRAKSLTKMTIIFMSFAIIFGFRNIVNNQNQFGLLACVLFLVGGAIYAIPMVLITAEFGSIKKLKNQEAGLGSFCVFALGEKGGFLASWSSYFGNLFFFATLAPFTIIALSYGLYGANGFDELTRYFVDENMLSADGSARASACVLAMFAILLFWVGTFISKKGPKWLGWVTNIGGTASLILGVVFILFALFYTIPVNGIQSNFKGWSDLNAVDSKNGFDGDWWSFLSAFPWLLFGYNGIETMSVFIKDTKKGIKAFKIASIIGMSIVISLMVIGGLVLSLTIDQQQISDWKIPNADFLVFPKMIGLSENSAGGKAIIHIAGLVTALNGIGSLFFWTAAPTKVFFSETPKNVMGKWLSKTDENGMPHNALLAQAIVVTVILTIVGVTSTASTDGELESSSEFLVKSIDATTTLAIVQMFFYFWGYIRLRLKMDDTERGTRFFKNKIFPIIICSITLIILLIAFFFGCVPSPNKWQEDPGKAAINFVFIFGGCVFFMGTGMLAYWINVERKERKNGGSIDNNSSEINEIHIDKPITKDLKIDYIESSNNNLNEDSDHRLNKKP
ncbi:amino acid permease family protein [Spiroplasma corruscae]|uniref:Amino acid permease family protein n=1 Tax=Spiroplasma corruscae TaxID=216934 RepID=A0A222EPE3_9MOLU|nr:amino acid permease [Spiroplasma corruscae]ASP28184.1 amino acid permease family protein [Spiroplasma corruscae]